MSGYLFSIVVLTHNRCEVLSELLASLCHIHTFKTEVIVVDNGSSDGTLDMVLSRFPQFKTVAVPVNKGAVGRNEGIRIASGTFIITIDDDILGLDDGSLGYLYLFFQQDPKIGAVCFKVIDFYSGQVCNWCHPYKVEEAAGRSFETSEISEGAVAFRREMLDKTGLYTEELFISHEGADLAARILNEGYEIHYTPRIEVVHKYSRQARSPWRRYYYDTRNDFWLVVRNYRCLAALQHLARRLPTTFLYALRDGYLKYWLRAVGHSIVELPQMWRQRKPISPQTHGRIKFINRHKPGVFYLIKKRFFRREVKI